MEFAEMFNDVIIDSYLSLPLKFL